MNIFRKIPMALLGLSMVAGIGATLPTSVYAASKAPVDLTYYYPVGVAGPLAQIMTKLVDSFNRSHPGIHVSPIFSGSYPQTLAKVETAIQGGNPPDVAVLNSTAQFDLIHLQAIEPLDSIVKAGDFFPALTQPKPGGHYWGVPFQRSTNVLYYNKNAFKKAGINPNQGPKTWAALVADGLKLKKIGMVGIEIPSDGTTYWTFEPFATEAGHDLGGNIGTQVYFNSAAAQTALQFWMNLSHKYQIMPKGILQWNDVPTAFVDGKTAMIVHSSGSLESILTKANFPVGVSFLPKDKSQFLTGLGGGDLYLFKGIPAAQRTAALSFIRWMSAPAQAAWWSMQTGYIATSPRAYAQPAMQQFLKRNPQARIAVEQLPYAQPELSTYQLNQVYDVIDSALQSVIDGQTSIKLALDQAQQQATNILAPYVNTKGN